MNLDKKLKLFFILYTIWAFNYLRIHEYLHDRYYKAQDLIKTMRKGVKIKYFIDSLDKYTKKEYEFIKQYNYNINQEIINKLLKII